MGMLVLLVRNELSGFPFIGLCYYSSAESKKDFKVHCKLIQYVLLILIHLAINCTELNPQFIKIQ